jgi:hypothetical protein
MEKLSVADLLSLEQYHRDRNAFRAEALAHKRRRQAAIGANVTLFFEDRVTVQYQVQEMLRIERIFENEAIEEELAAYNPLIPDGGNLKATMMIEFPDADERRKALQTLAGVEDAVYLEVEGQPRVMAIADEDLERSNAEKTSAVHFLRFEVGPEARAALERGAALKIGVDHPQYRCELTAGDDLRTALAADLA